MQGSLRAALAAVAVLASLSPATGRPLHAAAEQDDLGQAAASAAERVEFACATTPPIPFALRRARAQGIEPRQEPGTPLRGLLVRPEGAGPFPAVVLLHGCEGVLPFQERWAADLAGWGYVALLADGHGPRGIGDDCARWPPTAGNRTLDAFGALAFLRGLPFVDPARVGVMGWHTGGRAAMLVVDEQGVGQHFAEGFAAGVALYPMALSVARLAAPLLIVIGADDDCTPAARIQRAMREVRPGPFPHRVEVLARAGHAFDDPRFAGPARRDPARACLHWSETPGGTPAYDGAAREAAAGLARAFLDERLGR